MQGFPAGLLPQGDEELGRILIVSLQRYKFIFNDEKMLSPKSFFNLFSNRPGKRPGARPRLAGEIKRPVCRLYWVLAADRPSAEKMQGRASYSVIVMAGTRSASVRFFSVMARLRQVLHSSVMFFSSRAWATVPSKISVVTSRLM